MKYLTRILPVLAAVILLQAGMEKKGSFDITFAGDQAQENVSLADLQKKGSFDITFATGTSRSLPVAS